MVNNLIKEFKEARADLIDTVKQFPKDKKEEVLFDKWSLKDILVHLTGWGLHQIDTLRKFQKGKRIITPDNLKASINEDRVAKGKNVDWDTVFKQFINIGEELVLEYDSLPSSLWDRRIWATKEITPKECIQIEINHYKSTHGPQIKKVLKSFPYRYTAAVIVKDHKILLLKRSRREDDEAGKWCLVNESIEENEPPEKAVIRGAKEEIGTDFTIVKQLQDHNFNGRTAVFLGLIIGNIKPEQDEVDEYGWFSYEEAMRLEFAYGYEQVIQNLFDLKLIA